MRSLVWLVLAIHIATAHADPLPWQWDGASPDLFPRADLIVEHGGVRYRLAMSAQHRDHLALGNGTWTVEPAATAGETGVALAADDARVYLATYNHGNNGCTLAAYAASDGTLAWSVQLAGAEPMGHSKYFNWVQLRLIDGKPVVFGSEGAGRYIEAREPATGALISNTRLAAQYPDRPLAEPLFDELDHTLGSRAHYTVAASDFIARLRILQGADHAAIGAAVHDAARRLDGTPIQRGRYTLHVTVVDRPGDYAIEASRAP